MLARAGASAKLAPVCRRFARATRKAPRPSGGKTNTAMDDAHRAARAPSVDTGRDVVRSLTVMRLLLRRFVRQRANPLALFQKSRHTRTSAIFHNFYRWEPYIR